MRVRSLLLALVLSAPAPAFAQTPIFVDQGPSWTETARRLLQPRPRLEDDPAGLAAGLEAAERPAVPRRQPRPVRLSANPANSNGLPVGFTASGPAGAQTAGMTCSACHTRQITAEGKTYRIDGGPAIVDFQSFLADLDTAVGQVLASDAAFQPSPSRCSAPPPDPEDVAALRQRGGRLVPALPHADDARLAEDDPWGPARLDAVGMIFNRLTGLDLGPPPSSPHPR